MTLVAPGFDDRVRGAIVGAALGDAISTNLAHDGVDEYRVVEVMWGRDSLRYGHDTVAMLNVADALSRGDTPHLVDASPSITLVPLVLYRRGTNDALAAPRSSPADRARWRRVARVLLAAIDGSPNGTDHAARRTARTARGTADLSHLFAPNIGGHDIVTVIRSAITAPDEAITPAIAGAIVGAHVGLTGLPVDIIDRLEGLDPLLTAADALASQCLGRR